MSTERDGEAERPRIGDDPVQRTDEQLEEENPVDSPAGVDNTDTDGPARASETAKRKEEEALESGRELPG